MLPCLTCICKQWRHAQSFLRWLFSERMSQVASTGLYYDLELKMIAALKPRPTFLPILRMLNGVVEYDEVKGILVTENWQDRNRRASDDLQEDQRDRQIQNTSSSSECLAIFLLCPVFQARMVRVATTATHVPIFANGCLR